MITKSNIVEAQDWAARPENIATLLTDPILFGHVRDEVDNFCEAFGSRAGKEFQKSLLTVYKLCQ